MHQTQQAIMLRPAEARDRRRGSKRMLRFRLPLTPGVGSISTNQAQRGRWPEVRPIEEYCAPSPWPATSEWNPGESSRPRPSMMRSPCADRPITATHGSEKTYVHKARLRVRAIPAHLRLGECAISRLGDARRVLFECCASPRNGRFWGVRTTGRRAHVALQRRRKKSLEGGLLLLIALPECTMRPRCAPGEVPKES